MGTVYKLLFKIQQINRDNRRCFGVNDVPLTIQDDKFKVGQIWKYNTRTGEDNSTLTILKVEKYDSAGVVIHIYVNGRKVKNPQRPSGFYDDIGHLP